MTISTIDVIDHEWRLRSTGPARRRLRARWPSALVDIGPALTDHRHPDRAHLDRSLLVLLDAGDDDAGWALLATYPWMEPRLVRRRDHGAGGAAMLQTWITAGVLSDADVLETAWHVLQVRAASWPGRHGLDDYRWRYFGYFLARDVRRDLLARGRRAQPHHGVAVPMDDPVVETAMLRWGPASWWADPESSVLAASSIDEIRARIRPDQFSALAERSQGWTHSPDPDVSLPCWTARIHRGRRALGAVRPAV